MDIYILDRNFNTLAILDEYESLLWTDRYNAYGDFELYTAVSPFLLTNIKQDYYLWYSNSERTMIIDETTIATDVETGAHLTTRGRSLESLLERRIVWRQTILTGNFQNAILRLLNENVINPTDSNRKIPNFIFKASTDSAITSLTLASAQFTGDNLYEAIKALCQSKNVGFKVVLNSANQFEFSLFSGVDRSYAQNNRPYVIFAPNYDNVINSNYFETSRLVKTVALIAGEGEGVDRRTVVTGGGSGLDRKELFVDARDISSETNEGILTTTEYNAQLVQRGLEKMTDYIFVKTFEGEMETTQTFVYGKDFFLGDILQIMNEFGIEARTRITEIIFSNNNADGFTTVPTLQIVE